MKIFIKITLFSFLAALLSAQSKEYIIKQLKDADGLSQSTIYSMIQDRTGFLWFGTIDGLNRFDGYEFKVYENDPYNSCSISDNFISSLFEDSDGYIWVGTVNGYLNRFDRRTEKFKRLYINNFFAITEEPNSLFYDYPLAFSRNHINSITSIIEDNSGYLWIGTWGNGIIRLNRENLSGVHIYKQPGDKLSLSSNRIQDLLLDSSGEIWIATFGKGLNKLIQDTTHREHNKVTAAFSFIHYCYNESSKFSISDDKLTCLFEDRDKNIWVGTFLGGLNKLESRDKNLPPGDARFYNYKHIPGNSKGISDNTVIAIVQDLEGYLWIGTFGAGVDRFDPASDSFINFSKLISTPETITEQEILSLYIDRSGNLWVGSHLGEGVAKIQKNIIKFDIINARNVEELKLNDEVVWSVYKDSKNNLWVGTYRGGLNFFDTETNRTKIYSPPLVSDYHIRAITEDNFGNIWVGTYSGGLNRIEPLTGKVDIFEKKSQQQNSISANQVLDIYVESDSVIWAATYGGGLNKITFNKNSSAAPVFYAYRHLKEDPYSISDDRVYSLLVDSKQNFWVATYGGGLNRFDRTSGKFYPYRTDALNPKSISSDKVLSLLEDSKGRLWIGTSGGGLNRFDSESESFSRYSFKHGLLSAVVYGILEDKHNNLWLSTDDGIFKFNPEAGKFIQFSLEDGLQSMEFNGGAYFKDLKGKMYFGGINGLNLFHPDSITTRSYIPPVVITSIKIADEYLKGEAEELILSYYQNFISFEFSSLDFSNPLRNRYRFILEGFQKYWINTDASRRIATYTNLPPGEYLFRIIGTNSDGVWNEKGASVKIIINPPFWQTWWFVTLVIISVSFLIYFLSTLRIKSQLAIEKIKLKIASDLHDNVGAGLTEISILSEVAARENIVNGAKTSKELIKISDTARQLVDNMSDIVWVVNPQRDSLHDLIIKLKDSYNEFFNSVGVSFKVNNVDKKDDISLPMEYKQNLLLIFKEAINNSIKHSNCSKMTLDASVHNDNIEIFITDDGKGFDSDNLKFGNGMKNMFGRAEKIGGKIRWNSSPGKGTIVHFKGKLTKINKLKSFFNF